MPHKFPRLHNAMWPGLVGKGDGPGQEPPISLERMLELTAGAEVNGQRFDGVDYFLFHPHTDPDASDDELKRIADLITNRGLVVGSLVAPVWPGTVGGSAMGTAQDRANFVLAVRKACRIGKVFRDHGVRLYGCIRIDSAAGNDGGASLRQFACDPVSHTTSVVKTFREAARVASGYGERLAVESEVCWAGIHSWKHVLNVLELVDRPEVLGHQTDMSHVLTELLGINAPEHRLLQAGFAANQLEAAWEGVSKALGPWTFDFHVAQSDGTTHGSGSHDATGKHCLPDDPNGRLDIVRHAGPWLEGAHGRRLQHICWDGCMFPNRVLEDPQTWNTILDVMIRVREAHGWD